jgi:uncharacterized Zn-binding protein involved in type VI secretion
MGKQVISTAQLQCSFGAAPASLTVIPATVTVENQPPATIPDMIPTTNIPPFGMCSAPTNPTVIAATSAAAGVFTPAPCVPAPAGPWAPGSSKVLIGGKPALNDSSKCTCTWAGVISITNPGSTKTQIP